MQPLFGRDPEVQALNTLVDHLHERGGALVVRGEAGIGKSALLTAARRRARARSWEILTTAGVQTEANLPFAGLHQLLRPLLRGLADLPSPQRAALSAAFGLTDGTAPDQFLIALAALTLLVDSGARTPLLLLIEDAHWLDRSTAEVLTFVARRLDAEPLALLVAIRDGFTTPFDGAALRELRLEPLDASAAEALLDAHAPGLAPTLRTQLLEQAAGNPLALVELPIAWHADRLRAGALLPTWLPLTTRLERAFVTRLSVLPAVTRLLLLVAALDDQGDLTELLAATSIVLGAQASLEAIEPALTAGLVTVDDLELRFRHPLLRSAIYQAASVPQRHAVHAALAETLVGQPDRRVWQLASATIGPNAAVAAELEAAAVRARRRGGTMAAVAALERAARLCSEPTRRASLLVRAAELALELGQREMLARLRREVEPLALAPLDQGRLAWIRELTEPGLPGDALRVHALVETAERMLNEGETDLALNILSAAAARASWDGFGDEVRAHVVAAVEHVPAMEDDPRVLAALGLAAPIRRAALVLDRLRRRTTQQGADPEGMRLLGTAASGIGAYDLAVDFLALASDGLRAQGRLGLLARALVMQSWGDVQLGNWQAALPAADEGGRLALETGQPLWLGRALTSQAVVAGLSGKHEQALSLAHEAERIANSSHATSILILAQLARGLAALSDGGYNDAYMILRRVYDRAPAGDTARSIALGYLAEAAVHNGHRAEVCALLENVHALALQSPSPALHIGLRYAAAVLADDAEADALFQTALDADLTRWPLSQARLQLAYGAWLRRQRRVSESRAPLRAAREMFDTLGVMPWGERARQELRAAGEVSRRRTPNVLELLTPQELQIAQFAAAGLSNRTIGEKLYLSHRTVGSHLYRIFPKLGITHRSELRATLEAASPGHS